MSKLGTNVLEMERRQFLKKSSLASLAVLASPLFTFNKSANLYNTLEIAAPRLQSIHGYSAKPIAAPKHGQIDIDREVYSKMFSLNKEEEKISVLNWEVDGYKSTEVIDSTTDFEKTGFLVKNLGAMQPCDIEIAKGDLLFSEFDAFEINNNQVMANCCLKFNGEGGVTITSKVPQRVFVIKALT